MDIFRFENDVFLYGLALIPFFILLFIFVRHRRRELMEEYGETRLIRRLQPDVSRFKPWFRFVLLMITILFIVLGIANPQIGSKMEEVKREGVDVVIALDVSNSMEAEDIKPSRLERAKKSISRLIDKLRNDRIGIVAFAGTSFMQLPLTTDYSAAKLLLSTIDTDMIETQGTALGGAIETALSAFEKDDEKHKVLIIITDGENHEDDALGTAKKAAEQGVVIHTIGMGSAGGAPIPIYKGGNRVGFRKDKYGETILTKLDPGMLQQVAAAGNGRFISADGPDPDLEKLLQDIDKMEKKEYGSKMFTEYEDRFQYPIAAALVFIVFEFVVSDKRNKYLTALNVFAGGNQRREENE